MKKKQKKEIQAQAINEFVHSIIWALKSGFTDTNTITLAKLHSIMRMHCSIEYHITIPTITDQWGEEVAKLCGHLESNLPNNEAKDTTLKPKVNPPKIEEPFSEIESINNTIKILEKMGG